MSGAAPMRLRTMAGAVLTVLTAAMSGCDLPGVKSDSLSFLLGALVASQVQTTSVEYRCFADGMEVDCAELPSFRP